MSGRHRRSRDRRGRRGPAVAALLVGSGLVLMTTAAATVTDTSAPSVPAVPKAGSSLPWSAAATSDGNGRGDERGDRRGDERRDERRDERGDRRTDEDRKDHPGREKDTSRGDGTSDDRAVKAAPVPVRIVVPRLAIDSNLVNLGLTDTGHVEAPEDYATAGWFTEGPRPGEPGAAIIAGHVDDENGPAIFYHLSALRPGDAVGVERADGSTVSFRVTRVARHPKDDWPVDVFHAQDRELRLITCGGEFTDGDYTHNVVVYAEKR